MEKLGVHKRDIFVERVEKARDSQTDAQQQFKSALERFESVVKLESTDLKQAYEEVSAEYDAIEKAAESVSSRIDSVETVAEALFDEWAGELDTYSNEQMKTTSRKQLTQTKARYAVMLKSMKQAEKTMEPVLAIFRDNVLFMKHNLNAQAIGSLQAEFSKLKGEINDLIRQMNASIAASNSFIADLKK